MNADERGLEKALFYPRLSAFIRGSEILGKYTVSKLMETLLPDYPLRGLQGAARAKSSRPPDGGLLAWISTTPVYSWKSRLAQHHSL
jgi:hypothetical protein